MPSTYTDARRYEPTYVDDLSSLRGRDVPPPGRERPHRRHPKDDYDPKPRPRRHQTYEAPPRHYPSSDSERSSPPRHHRHRGSPRSPPRSPARPRRHRDEDYFSDNRYDRPRRDRGADEDRRAPPKDRHRERDRERDDVRKDRPARPLRKESQWQAKGKEIFEEYAVPALKAEAGKILTKQIGHLFAK